jgi:YD repeat-containing protein
MHLSRLAEFGWRVRANEFGSRVRANKSIRAECSGSPPRAFVFDSNGSTTNDAVNQYAYDTRGRMVQATSAAGVTSYQVNALGQRIRKTGTGVDAVFHYDTWGKLIAESDSGGLVKREYLYLGDIPVGVVQ